MVRRTTRRVSRNNNTDDDDDDDADYDDDEDEQDDDDMETAPSASNASLFAHVALAAAGVALIWYQYV